MKKLEAQEQKEIVRLIQQHQGEQVWARACSRAMEGRGQGRALGRRLGPEEGGGKPELCGDSLSGAEMGLKWEGE